MGKVVWLNQILSHINCIKYFHNQPGRHKKVLLSHIKLQILSKAIICQLDHLPTGYVLIYSIAT